MDTFLKFLGATMKHGIAVWSGPSLALAIAIFGWLTGKEVLPPWILWGMAGFCIALAMFYAWVDEHEKLQAANKSLAEAHDQLKTLKTPNLRAVIQSISQHPIPGYQDTIGVLFVIEVRNLGAPSIADHWRAVLAMENGNKFKGIAQVIPQHLTLTGPAGTVHYYERDTISNKIGEDALPNGSKKTGIIWFGFEGVSTKLLPFKSDMFTLSFTDATGHRITALNKTDTPDLVAHYPGLTLPPMAGASHPPDKDERNK